MYFLEGAGTIYMASALPNLKNAWPALPRYKQSQDYYITLGSLLVAMTIFDTLLNVAVGFSNQFYKGLKEHYFIIENALLLKSRKSIQEIERSRTTRVEQNILKMREEKGLVTVTETMNESDPNRTPNMSKNKTQTRFRNISQGQETKDIIKEESVSDYSDKSRRTVFSSRRKQQHPH